MRSAEHKEKVNNNYNSYYYLHFRVPKVGHIKLKARIIDDFIVPPKLRFLLSHTTKLACH